MLCAATVRAHAGLIITPTFAGNIVNDPNAAAIEAAINSAIGAYQSIFLDPINVRITFQEGGGLGGSAFPLFALDYKTFHDRLAADATSADDAAAIARLNVDGTPSGADPLNPVTGTDRVLIKPATLRALGFSEAALTAVGWTSDGTITLNTSLTTPGSPGSAGDYNLISVVEHEIDEILGLGSTVGLALNAPLNNYPSPQDFFRFTSDGARSFTASSSDVFFSIDGTTDLVQFNNAPNGGDYGDWQKGVAAQVQDAFATPGSSPVLGPNEIRNLDVIGYDLATPEPGSVFLMLGGLALMVLRFTARARA